MLRVVQQTNAGAAKGYYAAGYYEEGGEGVGVWGGRGAERLGLDGPVGRETFGRLCENRHPRTGERLTPRTRQSRRVGYDVSFHAPKSVSVLAELGRDPAILDAFRRAVDETLRELEADARTRVRAHGQDSERATRNLVWARFVHRTARPVGGVPDPHLHAHAFVVNATFDPAERRWKALDFSAVKRDAPYFEAAFHGRLAARLLALGYGVVRTATGWEVEGVPERVIHEFSRRTRQVEAAAAALGVTDPRAKDRLGATTQEAKESNLRAEALRELWAARLTDAERVALNGIRPSPGGPERGDVSGSALAFAVWHSFERSSVVTERELLTAGLWRAVGRVTAESLRARYGQQGVLLRVREGVSHATTDQVLHEEAWLLAFARRGRGAHPALGHETTPALWSGLTAEQARSVGHVLTSTDRVILLRGAAGTGKTTVLREAAGAIEATGVRVVALAPSAEASRGVLRGEGFRDADTIARFLVDEGLQAEARGQVLWVDEAGLVGTRTLVRLFRLVEQLDARVVLSGDRRQHRPVERGSALQLLEDEAGLVPAEVREIRRQTGAYRDAVRDLSDGRPAEGFDRLDELGWVVELPDGERERRLARDYTAAVAAGKSALVVAPTHAEGDEVTAAIRRELRLRGLLGSDETPAVRLVARALTAANRSECEQYEVGDVIEFHERAGGFSPGTRLTVTRVETERVLVRDAREVVTELPLASSSAFQTFRPEPITLAVGDLVRITQNGRTADGAHRLNNGAVYTVASFTRSGDPVLENGWVVGRSFGHLAHGYCLTSHASQGRTVDRVFVAQSARSYPASSPEQFYVSVSRGREVVTVYTDDTTALRSAVRIGRPALVATELARCLPVTPEGRNLCCGREWSRHYQPEPKNRAGEMRHGVPGRSPSGDREPARERSR